MTESFPASVNSIEKFEKEAGRPMSKSIEWCSKNVAIEGGLVRLFGPPPECHELDRIDLGRGALSVSKKVSEGMTEDGGKIYLASVEIEFGEEVSSSSVHVVMNPQKEDNLTSADSLSSLAQVIKDAGEGNKSPLLRSRGDAIETGGLSFSIYSSTVAEAQSWLKALHRCIIIT